MHSLSLLARDEEGSVITFMCSASSEHDCAVNNEGRPSTSHTKWNKLQRLSSSSNNASLVAQRWTVSTDGRRSVPGSPPTARFPPQPLVQAFPQDLRNSSKSTLMIPNRKWGWESCNRSAPYASSVLTNASLDQVIKSAEVWVYLA